ncbi:MAG TPA: hypothetical protein VMV10_18600 [Pirellulales bacterium]|nr:hypothetical protein [Pirellulales bacterium]
MARRNSAFDRFDAKLRDLAKQSPQKPHWIEAIESLSPAASNDRRLAAYQAVRNDGCLPDDAGLFLIAYMIDEITSRTADAKLRKVERRMENIERKYGLREGESWAEGEAPAEYEAARKRQQKIWDEAFHENLVAHGEREIAELFSRDFPSYTAKFNAGRMYFSGMTFSAPGELEVWVDELMQAVSGCISVDEPIGPLACRYLAEDGTIDVLVYPTPVEIVGGADDGQIVDADFDLDLIRLRELFSSVADIGWSALGLNDEGGPHIWVEGVFRGQPVFLQVLSQAPDDEEPGMKLDTIRKRRR